MSTPPPLVRSALAQAFTFFFPIDCAGCDEPDVDLCEGCVAALAPAVVAGGTSAGVPLWSGLRFDGVAARVIRAIKEDGRTSLVRALGPAVDAALARIARSAGFPPPEGATGHDAREALTDAGVEIVPVPTSRRSYRRRGFRVPDLLARRTGLPVAQLLRATRQSADQRGLSRDERTANVHGSLRAVRAAGRRVVVLDDVVTTGATLAEAVRALREGGADVLGAVSAAATLRHPSARNIGSALRANDTSANDG